MRRGPGPGTRCSRRPKRAGDAERYREQARRDPLTGLYNRRYVDENLPGLVAEAARQRKPVAMAMVDLDFFKRINDTLSHDTGDQVLVAVADILSGLPADPRGTRFVARLGGEEFLLVQAGAGPGEVAEMLENLRVVVRSHAWQAITGDLPVTVSVGAATTEEAAGIDVAELLATADHNLYEAKRAGRDRVVLS